jgi:hypothetical protein
MTRVDFSNAELRWVEFRRLDLASVKFSTIIASTILKKVKVSKNWNLYPAVVEPNGKLRDKVRVRGKVEVHPEGFYYIEWWQDGRKREQIKDHAEVVDRARRKAIGLQVDRAGIETVREIGSGTWFTVAEAVASHLAATRAKNLYRLQILPGTFCQQLRKAIYSRHKARRSASVHSQSVRTWLWTPNRLQPGGDCFAAPQSGLAGLCRTNPLHLRAGGNSITSQSLRSRAACFISLLSVDRAPRQGNALPDLARHRLSHASDSCDS